MKSRAIIILALASILIGVMLGFVWESAANEPREKNLAEQAKEWERFSEAEKKLIIENFEFRLGIIKEANRADVTSVAKVAENLATLHKDTSDPLLAVKAAEGLNALESEGIKEGWLDTKSVEDNAVIELDDQEQASGSISVDGRIRDVRGGVDINNDGRRDNYYKPLYYEYWIIWITVENTGSEDAAFYLKLSDLPGWNFGVLGCPVALLCDREDFGVAAGATYVCDKFIVDVTAANTTVWWTWELWWNRTLWPDLKLHTVYVGAHSDTRAPTSSVVFPTPGSTTVARSFIVEWGGTDGSESWASMIENYDVQVRLNGGPWQNWLLETTATSAVYTGVPGNTYYFQCRARDHLHNGEDYPGGDGDTNVTVT
ncbi:MAG: hypothetical protein FJZ93_11480 [Chloroflexi bacterium]|nr:hypothetical protein [Chloroflexota bacterium]